jgi:hypothetical protein
MNSTTVQSIEQHGPPKMHTRTYRKARGCGQFGGPEVGWWLAGGAQKHLQNQSQFITPKHPSQHDTREES